MATDDERREVAARLRGGYDVVSDAHGRFWLNGTLFGMDITARSEERIRDGLARLADLIEPGEPEVRCVAEVKVDGERLEKLVHDAAVELTGIDRDALLALADEMDRVGYNDWLHSGEWEPEEIARRIRGALGVES
jgi:hypothetical protein